MLDERKRYLVIGGRGFIGSYLVEALLAAGHNVRSFDRAGSQPQKAELEADERQFEFVAGDFCNPEDIARGVQGCDVCFHLVCTTLPKSSNADPVFDVSSNVQGSLRLLQYSVDAGLTKVVFVSSGGTVYGTPKYSPLDESHPTDPICSYGVTKLAIEKYCEVFRQLYGLEYSVLRLSNPYGERQRTDAGQGAAAVFSSKAIKGEPVEVWGDGEVIRDYIYVGDAAAALVAAAEYRGEHRVFNIGSGQGVSTNMLLKTIERCLDRKIERVDLPGRAFDVRENVLDISLAKSELLWRPAVDLETGLARLIAWLRG